MHNYGKFAVALAATLACSTVPSVAQEKPLAVPFTLAPPFMQLGPQGERTGFVVELSELIGAEIGVPITYVDVQDSSGFVAAQASGETQMIAGILQLPPLLETNVFSIEVARDVLLPAVLSERVGTFENSVLEGQRIGIVPPAAGSQDPLLDDNIPVPYQSPKSAIMGLLSKDVDAVLIPPAVVYALARGAGLDGRIEFLGDPIQEATRHVALHESRQDLLPRVNAVLRQLEEDGRLAALLLKYNLVLPDPPPAVLTVGITDLPPLSLPDKRGDHSGFNVEVMSALAERVDLDIQYVVLPLADWVKGPLANDVDVITALVETPARKDIMDFTSPILERSVAMVADTGLSGEFSSLADLAGLRVGVIDGSIFEARAVVAGLDITSFPTNDAILEAQQSGDVDVGIVPIRIAEQALARTETDAMFKVVELSQEKIDTAIALRPGLGAIRERLDGAISIFLLTDEFSDLRERYFGEPVYWTKERLRIAAALVAALVLVGLSTSIFLGLRARARNHQAMSIVKEELETIFHAATSGIVAFDTEGMIVRINNRARHFLGGLSEPTPFSWPKGVNFLDGENMKPLDASADPVRRAIAGVELRNATHLMNRDEQSDDARYVRLESTKVDNPETDIQTVIVLDDVSIEERNRQVIERKGRLEALGQLTGGIAHDFNNLLSTLLTSIFLAGRAKNDDDRGRQLRTAEDSILRARSLTTRLMAFAKKQPGLAESASVEKILSGFHTLVRPMLEATIQLDVKHDIVDAKVFCELAQLESALLNLVLNSRDAILRSGKGNKIELRARSVSGLEDQDQSVPADGKSLRFIEISVSDNGPGMNEEVLARAIDPFFTTKDTNSGTGLGLSMVYGFARQADGDLRIYSEEGLGTTVKLTLPRGTDEGMREEPVTMDEIVLGKGETILVAEDEIELLKATKTLLEEFGYKVIPAPNGREALKLVEDGADFDLLLTDVVMPGAMGGFVLAERLRELKPTVPVVYFSGYTGFSEAEMGNVKGILIQKPAVPAELSRAIATALSKKDG
ncbi:MAG: transporter substrate-binding domain-containing protein [Pseudomonadota bacterium]